MTSLIVTLDYIKYDKYNFKLNPILEISFNNQFANLSGIDFDHCRFGTQYFVQRDLQRILNTSFRNYRGYKLYQG